MDAQASRSLASRKTRLATAQTEGCVSDTQTTTPIVSGLILARIFLKCYACITRSSWISQYLISSITNSRPSINYNPAHVQNQTQTHCDLIHNVSRVLVHCTLYADRHLGFHGQKTKKYTRATEYPVLVFVWPLTTLIISFPMYFHRLLTVCACSLNFTSLIYSRFSFDGQKMKLITTMSLTKKRTVLLRIK